VESRQLITFAVSAESVQWRAAPFLKIQSRVDSPP
jgi:hypothetical protein